MDAIIQTDKLRKVYNGGKPDEFLALDDVSLMINPGDVAILKGPSGAGKTSLLSLIGCMSRPTAGRMIVAGKDVAKLPERFLTRIRRETFGFIFQHFNLIRDLTVLENVLLPLYPLGVPFGTMQQKGMDTLARLGIADKDRFKIRQLSGGEQQRAAIARALINDPSIIIADEPTAHLDTKLSIDLLNILEMLSRQGKTILIATHDPLVYEHAMVTRTITMKAGRLEEVLPK